MVEVEVLGIAQDGGVPHLGCSCAHCSTFSHRVASLLIRGSRTFLVDATPDITLQIRDRRIDGVFLTHLHIGHYTGLLQFGREVASTRHLPVYRTAPVAEFIRSNRPFSHLVDRGNVVLMEMEPDVPLDMGDWRITPFLVPHRNEDGDTVGFEVEGERSLCYIPDIDRLTPEVIDRLTSADVVLLDATFYDDREIGRQGEVPHPPVSKTVVVFGRPSNEFYLTHLNHTNPLLDPGSEERRKVEVEGYRVATEGQVITL